MRRITPRHIPPTVVNNSDPHASRGKIYPMEYDEPTSWSTLFARFTIGAAIGWAAMYAASAMGIV